MSDYDKMLRSYRKREDWGYSIFLGLMVIGAIAIIAGLMVTGSCVDSAGAVKAAEVQGFTNVELSGHDWFMVSLRGCSRSDAAKFRMQATNVQGQRVDIYVCSGWLFKGHTVRSE